MWATLREGGVRDGIVIPSERSRDVEEHRARGTRAARTIKDKIYQRRVRARAIRTREERELTADFPKMRVPLLCVASHKGASHKSLLRPVSSQRRFSTLLLHLGQFEIIQPEMIRDASKDIARSGDVGSSEISPAANPARGVKPASRDTPAKSRYARLKLFGVKRLLNDSLSINRSRDTLSGSLGADPIADVLTAGRSCPNTL